MIYIRVDAGNARGMGHLSRMRVLGKCLDSRGHHVRFVTRGNAVTTNILASDRFDHMIFPAAMPERELIERALAGRSDTPNLWIFDLLDTDPVWSAAIKDRGFKVVAFDDTKGALAQADLVVNAFVHSRKAYDSAKVSAALCEGLDYAIIAPSAVQRRRIRSIAKGGPLSVAVTMGGSDTHGASIIALKALFATGSTLRSVRLCIGPFFRNEAGLLAQIRSLPFPVEVLHAPAELHRELDREDVIICSGGMTLLEVCVMGLPALAFAGELHEERNISELASLKACVPIGSICAADEYELRAKIASAIFNIDLLNETAANAMRFVHDGTEVCVQRICGLLPTR